MPVARRSIYRSSAIEHYGQSREKDTSPRFASWHTHIVMWVSLVVLLALGLLSWSAQVPLYMKGSGVVLNKVSRVHIKGNVASGGGEVREESIAVVFLPSNRSSSLQAGQLVRIHLGTTLLESTIAVLVPGIISPYSACSSYGVSENCSQIISQPSVVAMVRLGTRVPVAQYAGSTLTAEVEVGTQRILPLLLGENRTIGG